MHNLSKFQIIVMVIFGVLIIGGVLAFSFAKKDSGGGVTSVNLTVWGMMPNEEFNKILEITGLSENKAITLNYVKKNKESFDLEFLEALASDVGPDMFFLDSDTILKYKNRIFEIPFSSYPERDFKNAFVESSEVLLTDTAIMGLPVSIDPLVMYWNRDIFRSAGLIEPPKYWDEVYDLSKLLTKKEGVVVKRSAVALGEFLNVNNAFEILSALILQSGNPITRRSGESLIVFLSDKMSLPVFPSERALSFFTEFSSPLKDFYSWNRSLPNSKDFFISGDLAIYFGLASELFEIQEKNPNLNFDVTLLPQAKEVDERATYAKIEVVVLSNKSRNLASAFDIAKTLSGLEAVSAFSQVRSLPPVRRDLLSLRPERSYMEVFYNSAIISKNWLKPDLEKSKQIFRNMVESVTSGRSRSLEAVTRASSELNSISR